MQVLGAGHATTLDNGATYAALSTLTKDIVTDVAFTFLVGNIC